MRLKTKKFEYCPSCGKDVPAVYEKKKAKFNQYCHWCDCHFNMNGEWKKEGSPMVERL